MATTADEVAKHLAGLDGQDFEDEVCSLFVETVLGFQPIPAANRGDAGLDGLSHDQSCAYCCYGLQLHGTLKKPGSKAWNQAVINKFSSDLRTICELESDKAGGWKHKPTVLAATIYAPGRKLKHVHLIVSTFPNPEVIGPLNKAFDEYKAASQRRYIEKTASLVVWGAVHVAAKGATELTLHRLQQRVLLATMRGAYSNLSQKPPTSDLDDKFDWLRTKADPSVHKSIDMFAEHFRRAWTASIAADNHFANTSAEVHRKLEFVRNEAIQDAALAAMGAGMSDVKATLQELRNIRDGVRGHMKRIFEDRLDPELSERAADGETGRLIGECHLEWRK